MKTTSFKVLVLSAAIMVFQTNFLSAQQTLSGSLSGNLGPDTYIVVADCDIPAGETLTIAPGTVFLFSGNYYWWIFGTLQAEGTETDSIVFTRQDPIQAHRWGGLRFQMGAPDNSVISYCLIDNCMTLFYNGGGISSQGVALQVLNTTIQMCQGMDGGAFHGEMGADVDFIDCVIADNTASSGAGLNYEYGTMGEVRNCVIKGNYSSGT